MSISRCTLILALTVASMINPKAISMPKNQKSGSSPPLMVELLDVMSVSLDNPQSAVKSFTLPAQPKAVDCDILIVGGGTGGIAAAQSACSQGLSVILTEETDWLGGQMTSQGVAALDENYLVETSGANLSYQNFRTAIRNHYQKQYQLTPQADQEAYLNPGTCWVSRLSFEPSVALQQIDKMLSSLINSGQLRIYYRLKAARVKIKRHKIEAVDMVNLDNGSCISFRPRICLDATELGDLLALSGAPYVTGSESRQTTGEPHAPETANPENVQDYVYPFVVKYHPGQDHTISRPPHYDEFNAQGKFSFNGYRMFSENSLVNGDGNPIELLPFWTYRRLIDKTLFADFAFDSDLSMINWDSNDLRGENIIDKSNATAAQRLARAKALSLGFLYWLQTAASRDDGGHGYPEVMLQTDLLGTGDGLSKYPYIRESRRLLCKHPIVEQQIAAATNSGARAHIFPDAVGIGLYPIDIHGHQEIPGAGQAARPFQIPLSALLPQKPHNLLAAAKNIGTTHITNGSYRLHPIEWAVGEAAGLAARYSLKVRLGLRQIAGKRKHLRTLQNELLNCGIPLYWFDDVPTRHPHFAAIQFLTVTGVFSSAPDNLHFRPDEPITTGEAARAVAVLLKLKPAKTSGQQPAIICPEAKAIQACRQANLLNGESQIDGGLPLSRTNWEALSRHPLLPVAPVAGRPDTITRAEFAAWLYPSAVGERFPDRL